MFDYMIIYDHFLSDMEYQIIVVLLTTFVDIKCVIGWEWSDQDLGCGCLLRIAFQYYGVYLLFCDKFLAEYTSH